MSFGWIEVTWLILLLFTRIVFGFMWTGCLLVLVRNMRKTPMSRSFRVVCAWAGGEDGSPSHLSLRQGKKESPSVEKHSCVVFCAVHRRRTMSKLTGCFLIGGWYRFACSTGSTTVQFQVLQLLTIAIQFDRNTVGDIDKTKKKLKNTLQEPGLLPVDWKLEQAGKESSAATTSQTPWVILFYTGLPAIAGKTV